MAGTVVTRLCYDCGRSIPAFAIIWIVLVIGCQARVSDNLRQLYLDIKDMGIEMGEAYSVVKSMVVLTLLMDLVVLASIAMTTGRALEYSINKCCRGKGCLVLISKSFFTLLLWLCFGLSWGVIASVIITLVLCVGITVTFFISSIICQSGASNTYIMSLVNSGLAEYAKCFKQTKVIEISETMVPQLCGLWPDNFKHLGQDVVLSGVAVLAQVNLAIEMHKRCLAALWKIEKIELVEQKDVLQERWASVTPDPVY